MSIDNMIGMSCRAGRAVSGFVAVKDTLAKGRAKLLVIASDAGPRTRQELLDLASFNHVPVIIYSNKVNLGILIGNTPRSVIAITESNIADKIKDIWDTKSIASANITNGGDYLDGKKTRS